MEQNVMIRLEDVSMRFNLGIEKNASLKQKLIDRLSPKKRKEDKEKKDFWALSDISFEVRRGEVLGLVGSNGAGKSTLLKIVAGVMKPTRGRIDTYGTICPMIELGAGFDMDLTARENVFLNAAVMGYTKSFIESKFREIMDFAELWDFVDVPIKNFSSGMTARLAFSIATLVDPEILIVDEILSVGDMAFQKKSEDKMLSMIRGGTTVLFVSHSLASVQKLCGRALWLDKGRAVAIGDTDSVSEKYRAFSEQKT